MRANRAESAMTRAALANVPITQNQAIELRISESEATYERHMVHQAEAHARAQKPEVYLTPMEVAKQLRCSAASVSLWIRKGKLSAARLGKVWRISERQVEDFLRRQSAHGERS